MRFIHLFIIWILIFGCSIPLKMKIGKDVDAESFTTWRRWKDAPHALKRYVDKALCEGLDMITFHTFANTRPEHVFPGRAYLLLLVNSNKTKLEKHEL